jgi:hypothetical protein
MEFTFHNTRYSMTCTWCSDLLDRAQLLTQIVLIQGYVILRLKLSVQTLYGRHHELVGGNEYIPIYEDVFFPLSLTRHLSDLTMSNMTGTVYPS